jgi:hypothetical protein
MLAMGASRAVAETGEEEEKGSAFEAQPPLPHPQGSEHEIDVTRKVES